MDNILMSDLIKLGLVYLKTQLCRFIKATRKEKSIKFRPENRRIHLI